LTSPTDAARTALRRLSELGLPPTPDNFQRFYAEAGGEGSTAADAPAAPPVANSEAEVLMDAVRQFAEELAETTGSLAEDIGQHNADLLKTMAAATPPPSSLTPQVATLLSSVLSITSTIHSTVQASHAELLRAREEIDDLRRDLKQSRDWLLQDPLTGMQNRRGMDSTLFHEVARARRSGTPLSIAMLDIDHFKQLNDSHGHHAGDRALMHLSEVVRSVLRDSDTTVRYGGEEFVMILPETDLNGARFVVDRLRLVVRKSPLIHEGQRIPLSLSAGIAQLQPAENGSALLLRADRATLQAKSEGRDRVVESVADMG
jgi:diguanylate cyclase